MFCRNKSQICLLNDAMMLKAALTIRLCPERQISTSCWFSGFHLLLSGPVPVWVWSDAGLSLCCCVAAALHDQAAPETAARLRFVLHLLWLLSSGSSELVSVHRLYYHSRIRTVFVCVSEGKCRFCSFPAVPSVFPASVCDLVRQNLSAYLLPVGLKFIQVFTDTLMTVWYLITVCLYLAVTFLIMQNMMTTTNQTTCEKICPITDSSINHKMVFFESFKSFSM